MLSALATHLKQTLVNGVSEYDVVSMVRLTGINRTTDEFRLPEEILSPQSSCSGNLNAVETWLTATPQYDYALLKSAWNSIVSSFQTSFNGKYFNLPIIPDGTGTGQGAGENQYPFPEIGHSGCVYDPPVNINSVSWSPAPAPSSCATQSGYVPMCTATGQTNCFDPNLELLQAASQAFSDRLTIEFESLNSQHPANPYVVQQAHALKGGAAFMTNNWLASSSPPGGAACTGGVGSGTACTAAEYFKLLEQGIYLSTGSRAQFLEVFYTDVLRGPASAPLSCAVWQAHIDLTDYTAPVTSATIGPVAVSFIATDDSTTGQPPECNPLGITTEFSLDGGATWTKGQSVDRCSLGEQQTVLFRSTDVAGNQESVRSISVRILPKIDRTGLQPEGCCARAGGTWISGKCNFI